MRRCWRHSPCRLGWRRPRPLSLTRALPIKSRIALAWVSLWLERIWNGLWPTQAVLLALLALALSGLLPETGPWLHSLALITAAGWLGWTLWQRRQAWRAPSWEEATRRLEQDSGVPHRPLQGMADKPLGDDPVAQRLWQAHQRQLAAHVDRLQPQPPANALPRIDRFAWRAGAFLALMIAVVLAGQDWLQHLQTAVQPRFAAASAEQSPTVDVWIEPPAYTRRPPVFAAVSGEPLRVPFGSTLVARVSYADAPTLAIDAQSYPMEAEAEQQHALTLDLLQEGQLSIRNGSRTLAEWPLYLVQDQPPTAAFAAPPSETQRQALRIDYAFADDYGVAEAWAEMRLAGGDGGSDWDDGLRLPFPLPGADTQTVRSSYFEDLTPHRWAGRSVTVELWAKDGIGQEGVSEAATVTLPERVFTHPVAKEIIAARKRLDAGAPSRDVALAIAKIAQYPARFNEDTVVFLGLSSSMHRLRLSDGASAREPVRDVLWDLALRLEDGDLPGAERDLRAAQQTLQEALARDVDDAEIRRLIEDLREAMRRFANEMANRAGQQPPLSAEMPPSENVISDQDLERMLDRIQQLAESGSREAARNLLSQLQQMLESLQSAQQMTAQQQQQTAAMTQMLNQLQEMQRRQQSLIDETFQQQQQSQPAPTGPPDANAGQPPGPFTLPNFNFPSLNLPPLTRQSPPQSSRPSQEEQPGQPMPGLAQRQDQLRRDLGELMRQMGEQMGGIPGNLQQAEQAMRDARQNLQQGAGQPALNAEGEALDRLRQAGQNLSQQLSRQMGMNPGPGQPGRGQPGFGQPGNQRQGQRDPLGRERNDGQATEFGPRIPNETETQRARRIRDMLYKRSADPNRPVLEQDYLRRLLERF